ncbi:MAG: sel1 repeat family protein [Sphingomonadaceae bacterium]|nr:sel1 repeat family protein [Sphingomonadaceae bacterium]
MTRILIHTAVAFVMMLIGHHALAQDVQSCQAGNAQSCIDAGNVLISKDNPQADLPKGRAMFERACNLGKRDGCTLAGQLFLSNGKGLTADYAKGLALLERACREREGYACHLLGSANEAGSVGLPKNRDKAVSYFKAACEVGKANSCGVLHNMLMDEVPKAQARPYEVAETYGRACQNGLVSVCAEAVVLAYDGGNGAWPQAIDWQMADRNALAGCKNRVKQACIAGEKMFSNPVSKAFDLDRGRMYSDASCRLSIPEGCYNKANLLILKEEYAGVANEFGSGCKLGHKPSCVEQSRWQTYGRLQAQYGNRDAGRIILLDRMVASGDVTGAFLIAINDFRSEPIATFIFNKAVAGGKLSQLREIDLVAYSVWNTAPQANRTAAERESRARIADHNRRAAAAEAARRAQIYASSAGQRPVGSLGPNARFLVCHRDVNGLCDYKVQDGL